jgi:S1-C subfamily serine protease
LVAAPIGAAARPSDQPSSDGSFFKSFAWSMSKGRLGVSVMSLSPELRTHFGSTDGTGVLVSGVESGMPGAKAGIAVGDVITRVDGKVVDDAMDVIAALSDAGNKRIDIEVLRDKKLVKLGASLDPNAPQTSFNGVPWLDWFHDFLHGAREGAFTRGS